MSAEKNKVKEMILSIRGIDLRALHWQPNPMSESNVKILALHGWLDNAQSFEPLASYFKKYEIIAPDFPGHGKSGHRPISEMLHFVDYVADVHELIRVLNWKNCILLGHSMGGGIASLYASAFSDKLAGLICLDGLGPASCEVDVLPEKLMKSITLATKQNTNLKAKYLTVESAVKVRKKAGDLSLESARLLVGRNLKKVDDGYRWRSDPRLLMSSPYYLSEQQVKAYLNAISVPTMVIQHSNSWINQTDILQQRAECITNLTWLKVAGGHHAHMDHPKNIASGIKEFIKSLE